MGQQVCLHCCWNFERWKEDGEMYEKRDDNEYDDISTTVKSNDQYVLRDFSVSYLSVTLATVWPPRIAFNM